MSDCCGVKCEDCFFGGKKVGAKGNIEAPIVFVGESPGAAELSKGEPFVGPSGKLLHNEIPDDLDYYVTNAIQCLPKRKDDKRLNEACKRCRDRLLDEIKAHPRKIIIAMGNGALRSLTGNFDLKITQERGKIFPSELAEYGIIASVHPAFLLRGGGSLKKFKEDIAYGISLGLDGKSAVKEPILPEFELVQTVEQAKEALKDLSQYQDIAADVETGGFNHRTDALLSIGLAGTPEKVYIFPGFYNKGYLPDKYEGGLDNDDVEEGVWDLLRVFLESDRCFIWHNGKFDIKFLREQLEIGARVDGDTMLLNYSLDETRGVHDLEQVGADVIGMPNWKKELEEHLPSKKHSYAVIPRSVLNRYLANDVSATLQIYVVLRKRVSDDKSLEKLYTRTLLPASEFLSGLEMTGFRFDWNQWQKNKDRLEKEVEEEKRILCETAGYDLNPNSPAQVAKLLFDDLQIPSKHGRSTAKEVIDKLPDLPAVKALRKYRKANKALTTYVTGFAKNIDDNDRAYSTYLLHGTPTGRLASRNPNMQNIPRDAELRGMFIPDEGHKIIDLDYSQAELRSLAQLSGDPTLMEIFCDTDRSLHKEVAKDMYGLDYDEEQYIRAKAVNFGIAYGREAFSLAEEFEISIVEAKRLIEAWFSRFPLARDFIMKCREAPMKQQTMVTMFGRKKRPQLVTRDRARNLQNEAANFPHQSTASDLTLHSGIKLLPIYRKMGVKIVNIVHDSLVLSCPNREDLIQEAIQIGCDEMEKTPREWGLNRVPFTTDSKVLDRWGK